MDISSTNISESFFTYRWKNKSSLALDWKEGVDKPYCVDYSSAYDNYEAEIEFMLKESEAESIITGLEKDRTGTIVLSNFNDSEHIFGENVDYSGSINCKLTGNPEWEKESIGVYSLKLNVVGVNIAFTGSSSFPDLTYLDPVFQGRIDFRDTHVQTSKNNAYAYDLEKQYGVFVGSFWMNATEYGKVLEWMRVNRSSTLSLSSFGGLSELFGFTDTASFPYIVRVRSVKAERTGVNNYNVEIEFIE